MMVKELVVGPRQRKSKIVKAQFIIIMRNACIPMRRRKILAGKSQARTNRLASSLLLSLLFCCGATLAGQTPAGAEGQASQSAAPPTAPTPQQSTASAPASSISGTVVDPKGVAIAGATIKLTRDGDPSNQQAVTGDDGKFTLVNVAPGPFHLTIGAAGFATQQFTGNLRPGEAFAVPQVMMALAEVVTEVHVSPPQIEVAQEQVKEQEKQRALGIIPNFYVSYVPDAVPLSSVQKFQLAWKSMIDPVTFGITGAIAGLQQAQNDFSGYGQGAEGYGKRYGAAYTDTVTSTLIGGAILPSLFKQDPRYFYKGTGSKRSRLLYALANSVICKGDNGHWQANYSALLGSLAAGGISNLYYPAKDRDAGLTFQNFAIGIGATAAANVLQEFVVKKLTSNVPARDPGNGNSSKSHSLVSKAFSSLIHSGD